MSSVTGTDDLGQQAEWARSELQVIARELQSLLGGCSPPFPDALRKRWESCALLHVSLGAIPELAKVRTKAFDVLALLRDHARNGELMEDRVDWLGTELSFREARYLATAAYITATWAVYDSISCVVGRLAGPPRVANARWNPKLWGDILTSAGPEKEREAKQTAHFVDEATELAFAWPATVAYKLRNCVVHDGHQIDGHDLFSGCDVRTGFVLSDRALEELEKAVGSVDQTQCRLYSCQGYPWYSKDLVEILRAYHGEVDFLLGRLLRWSVESLQSHIRVFTT